MDAAKIGDLTNMVLDTAAAMNAASSGGTVAGNNALASVDPGGDSNDTQDSGLSASNVVHTNTNDALSLVQSMELNSIR